MKNIHPLRLPWRKISMPQLQEVLYRAAEAGKRSLLPLSPCVESFVCQVGGANDWLIQRDDMRIIPPTRSCSECTMPKRSQSTINCGPSLILLA